MIDFRKTMAFFDRGTAVLIVLIVCALIFSVATYVVTGNYNAKNSSLEEQIAVIQSLTEGVLSLKTTVESKEKKIRSSKAKGVVSSLEQTLSSLGLKASAIKPLEKKKIDSFMEEKAELDIQDTDLNSIVNLLYQIENSPVPMKINSASIKTTFEDPDKFMFKLSVSLLSR